MKSHLPQESSLCLGMREQLHSRLLERVAIMRHRPFAGKRMNPDVREEAIAEVLAAPFLEKKLLEAPVRSGSPLDGFLYYLRLRQAKPYFQELASRAPLQEGGPISRK